MELDVHLKRSDGEPWGFELTGGSDDPIKINKVIISSPAEQAGLKDGDVMSRIQGVRTTGLSLDAVTAVVEDVEDKMTIAVTRGLYDPVIDDQEPIYDTYEPADFGPQSEPTEVQFKIQQFIPTPTLDANIGQKLVRPTPSTSSPLLQPESIREPRPLTPFDESKRYRPFSTEPLPEVPPLENPIILNPNYRDAFSRSFEGEIEAEKREEKSKESKFKLPVSEQYDPDGIKKKIEKKNNIIGRKVIEISDEMLKYIKTAEEKNAKALIVKKETLGQSSAEKKETKNDNVLVQKIKEQKNLNIDEEKKKEAFKFIHRMRQEVDLTKIEETALNIVEENIERAVSVTEEIKKEIDDIFSASVIPKIEVENILHEDNKEIYSKELQVTIDKIYKDPLNRHTLQSKVDRPNVKAVETTKEQTILAQNKTETRKQNIVVEKISEQTVIRGEKDIRKQTDGMNEKEIIHRNRPIDNTTEKVTRNDIIVDEVFQEKSLNIEKEDTIHNNTPIPVAKNIITHQESDKPSAEQRTPTQININDKNIIKDSFHSDEVKTFTQKYDPKEKSYEHQEIKTDSNNQYVNDEKVSTGDLKTFKEMSFSKDTQSKHFVQSSDLEERKQINNKEHINLADEHSQTKKSGVIIPQLCERKTLDLIPKMDAVISEFHSKATIEENNKGQRARRSRSRSQIEQEVMRESDPLEWLAKVDSRRTSQERKISTKRHFSSKMESTSKRFETMHESKRFSSSNPKATNQMYVAIVESHVYTNKDAIFEDKVKQMSDISSVENTERVNTSFTRESVFTENRSILSSDIREHTARVINTREIPLARAKSETNFEVVENVEENNLNSSHKSISQAASASRQCKQAFVQEIQQVMEPVQKIDENIAASKTIKSQTIKDELSIAVAESTEMTDVAEAKPFDVKFVKPEIGTISTQKRNTALTVTEVETEMSNLPDYKPLKTCPMKPSVILEKQRAVAISEIDAIDNNLSVLNVTSENLKTISSIGVNAHTPYQVAEIEPERNISELKILKNHTATAKMNTVTQIDNALEVNQIDALRDDIHNLELPAEKLKELDSVSVVENTAVIVNEINADRDELIDLNVVNESANTAVVNISKGSSIAVQITKREAIRDDLSEFDVVNEKTKTIQSVDFFPLAAVQIYETEVTRDELTNLDITKAEPKVVNMDVVDCKLTALQISEIQSVTDELSKLETNKEKLHSIESIDYIEQAAIGVTEADVTKDELFELTTPKVPSILPKKDFTNEKHTAIEISEIEPIRDDLTELETKTEKIQTVQSANFIENIAVNVSKVEEVGEKLNNIHLSMEKNRAAKIGITEGRGIAVQINEIMTLTDDFAELNESKAATHSKASIDFVEQSAVHISKFNAIEHEISELKVPQEKTEVAQTKVTKNESKALVISEIESVKDELTELEIAKYQKGDISLSMENEKAHAILISEVESKTDEIMDLNIKKQQLFGLKPSLEMDQKFTAVQITEIEAIRDEISELSLSKLKASDVTKSVVETAQALLISEIETRKDECTELLIPKLKVADVSASLTAKNLSALQITEIETAQTEFAVLNFGKHQFININPSLEDGKKSSAVQITEIESIKDEIAEFHLSKYKASDVTESVVETEPALQINEVDIRKDEFTESLYAAKSKTVDVSTSVTSKKLNALQITEVEATKNEFAELNIRKHQLIDIAPSVEVRERTSAVQITEVESLRNDISELNISKKETADVTESVVETAPALQISEVETRKDEFTELHIVKSKTAAVSATVASNKLRALKITEVETAQNEFAELNIKKHQFIDITPSMEVGDKSSGVEITEIESIADDMADLHISNQKTMDATETVVETPPTIEINEVEIRKDKSNTVHKTKQEAVNVSASIKARKSKTVQIVEDGFAELNIKKQPSVEIEDDSSTSVEITEIDTEEDLSKYKVAQNGFSKNAEIIQQKKSTLQIGNGQIKNEYAGLSYARHSAKKEKVELEVNDAAELEMNMKQSKIASSIAQSKDEIQLKVNNAAEQGIHMKQSKKSSSMAQSKHKMEKAQTISKKTEDSRIASHQSVSIKTQNIEMSEADKSSSKSLHKSISKNSKKLTLETNLAALQSITMECEVTSPSPPILPPTPLTDEYIFRLEVPLPKSRSTTPIPPEYFGAATKREDPHIVKKKLIPHIEVTIERIIYDPPLPTPPEDKPLPIYTKPGLRGGAAYPYFIKEEIREIEKESSLLATAIDRTIKSIEEYKQEVGIETKEEINQETSKSELTSTKTITEHKIISEIIQNGDVSSEERLELDAANFTSEKEHTEIEKQPEENGSLTNIIDVNENLSKLKTDIKINMHIDIPPQVPSTKTDDHKTDTENEEPTEEIEIKPKEVKELEIKEVVETKSYGIAEVNNEAPDKPEKVDITNTNEEKLNNDTNTSDTLKVEVEILPIKVEETQFSSIEEIAKTKENIIENNVSFCQSEGKQNEVANNGNKVENVEIGKEEEKIDYLQYVKPVKFDPEAIKSLRSTSVPILQEPIQVDEKNTKVYVTDDGEILGTKQGIVDGLEEPVFDEEVTKDLDKSGFTEEVTAELISGEADILREAHEMGLSQVVSSHVHHAEGEEDLTIKPVVSTLKDSEVLKALNEEIVQKKLEEKRWTTFLQKPKRPVPRPRFGYQGYVEEKEIVEEPYKVVIVKQPKPKIAPDFKPEDYNTGPLPWEERLKEEAFLPPVNPEEPILVPEEPPVLLEAVDHLLETGIPDLENTGLLEEEDPTGVTVIEEPQKMVVETEDNRLAEELVRGVQSMVDPNANLEQKLMQMKAQLAALAKLRGVIQQTLDFVSKQHEGLSIQGKQQTNASDEDQFNTESFERKDEESTSEVPNGFQAAGEKMAEAHKAQTNSNIEEVNNMEISIEEYGINKEEEARLREEIKNEQQRKERILHENSPRQIRQRPMSRAGKPKPLFGPLNPEDRPVILPGGRKWRRPEDVYDKKFIVEMMQTNAEVIQGKDIGINFMKHEMPPVSLEHLKNSEVFKVVHNLDDKPLKRVELLGPVIAEADYREMCRSRTPNITEKYNEHPPQFQP